MSNPIWSVKIDTIDTYIHIYNILLLCNKETYGLIVLSIYLKNYSESRL